MRLLAQPSYTGAYDIDKDRLWTHTPQALPIDVLAWYQCDHLGTPQELTDHTGQIAWSAQYSAWGEVKEQRSEWAQRQGLTNPIRFQGQYHDHETGLHYNRYRYYDPRAGRFVSKDPISYAGGLNLYAYAPNPVEWVDPLGLMSCTCKIGANGAGDWARLSGQLTEATKGKGNFGIGSGTREQAGVMGKAWVGDGYKVASDGKTLVSQDGLRQYRPPTYKPSQQGTQANFEQRFPGQETKKWQSNAHLDITD